MSKETKSGVQWYLNVRIGWYIHTVPLIESYINADFSLYRDEDGLVAFRNISGTQSERIKKDFIKIFLKKIMSTLKYSVT